MSIRMHMAMGYGFDLGEVPFLDRTKLDIDRLEDKDLFELWKWRTLDYAKSASGDIMERLLFHEKMIPPTTLADMIVFNDEFGLTDKLLVQPAGSFRRWSRYGDHLDAYAYEAETGIAPTQSTPTWTPHDGWLHPYAGYMVPDRTTDIGIRKIEDDGLTDMPEGAVPWAPWHLFFLLQTVFDLDHMETVSTFLSLRPHIYRYWA